MTNAQTEARAIAPDREHYEAANKIWRLSVVECKHAIATALAAKDAELAAVKENCETVCNSYADENQRLYDRAERAEAQLAEANKALEDWWAGMRPSGWSRDQHAANPRVNLSRDGEKALADIAARRALEAQGGENG